MNKCGWRNTVIATVSKDETLCRGKLAFKTQDTSWIETEEPVIVVVSVYSRIHDDISGDLKMHALMKTIKSHVRGRITVFIAERAHLQADSLSHQGDLSIATHRALDSARSLTYRYQEQFEGCTVAYWHSYICQDESFLPALGYAKALYAQDPLYRAHVETDAESTYTPERMQEYPNKAAFLERTIKDLLEQCACVLVFAKKGYRFQFYPGNPYACTEYINGLNESDNRISWINVSLRIEKRTITKNVSRDQLVNC